MAMNPEREAEAMKGLKTERVRRKTYERTAYAQQITWREWERTREFPTHDGESGMQNHQQKRCEMADNFSANLRRLVDDHDESLGTVADSVGVSVGTLHSYLVNRRVPRLSVVSAIARFYRIEPAHLMFSPPEDC